MDEKTTYIFKILGNGLDLVMGHVLIPVLYRVCSTDIRLIPMLRGELDEMSVS